MIARFIGAKFRGPTWGPPGSCRPQVGPMLAPKPLLLGIWRVWHYSPICKCSLVTQCCNVRSIMHCAFCCFVVWWTTASQLETPAERLGPKAINDGIHRAIQTQHISWDPMSYPNCRLTKVVNRIIWYHIAQNYVGTPADEEEPYNDSNCPEQFQVVAEFFGFITVGSWCARWAIQRCRVDIGNLDGKHIHVPFIKYSLTFRRSLGQLW